MDRESLHIDQLPVSYAATGEMGPALSLFTVVVDIEVFRRQPCRGVLFLAVFLHVH